MKEFTINSLSKKEIADMLRDYALLISQMSMFPDTPVDLLYHKVVKDTDFREKGYYNKMLRVSYNMMLIKKYSLLVDEYMHLNKKINIDELEIDEIMNNVFVDSNEARRFSKKQFCVNIRTAFNHNSKDKNLYKITRNGKKIEIILKEANPIPFHIKINMDQLSELSNQMSAVGRNILTTEFDCNNVDFSKEAGYLENELKKVVLKRRYFKGKMSLDLINDLSDTLDTEFDSKEDADENINKWIDCINDLEHVQKEFKLDKNQIEKSVEKIEYLKNNFPKFYKEAEPYMVRNAMIATMPVGVLYSNRLVTDMLINNFLADKKVSYNFITKFIKNSLVDGIKKIDDPLFSSLNEFIVKSNPSRQNQMDTWLETLDINQRLYASKTMYFEYLLKEFITDDQLKNELPKEFNVIRNAFTHGRHYLGTNNEAHFYDGCGRGPRDYEFGAHVSLEIAKIAHFSNLIQTQIVDGNEKQFIKGMSNQTNLF